MSPEPIIAALQRVLSTFLSLVDDFIRYVLKSALVGIWSGSIVLKLAIIIASYWVVRFVLGSLVIQSANRTAGMVAVLLFMIAILGSLISGTSGGNRTR